MFSDRLIYPFYATVPPVAGFTPLGDQIVAGAIMWVPGSLFYLIPGALIMFRMLAPRDLAQMQRRIFDRQIPSPQVPSAPHL
jgi:cytochrome c oxidase assembly factor CtaG